MSAQPFKFGQTVAADYVPFDSSTASVWIRTFKNGSTQLRIAPAEAVREDGSTVYGSQAWPMEYEHFDRELSKSYACPRKHDSSAKCFGCESSKEATRRRTRTYYINALDDQGELRIFKFGVKLFTMLDGRDQRLRLAEPDKKQPLSERDVVVIRSGQSYNEIQYDVDYGERYPVDWDAYELHDISKAIGDAYTEAWAAYGDDSVPLGEPADADTEEEAEEPKRPARKTTPVKRTTAKKAAVAKPKPEEDEDDSPEEFVIPPNGKATEEDLDNAETTELRRWLDESGIEYPKGAPRMRLVKIAKAERIPF